MTKLLTIGSRVLVLILGLSILQVYSTPVKVLGDAGKVPAAVTGRMPFARLTTGSNAPIIINGATGRSGDTIFSGQMIQTPAGVGATITILGVGRADAGPNSRLALSFSQNNVSLSGISGCVVLATLPGVGGAVEAPDVTRNLDPKTGGTLDVCTEKNVSTSLMANSSLDSDDSGSAESPAVGFGTGTGFGTGYGMGTGSGAGAGSGSGSNGKALSPLQTVLVLGGAGAFVLTAILVSRNNNNPSPSRVG